MLKYILLNIIIILLLSCLKNKQVKKFILEGAMEVSNESQKDLKNVEVTFQNKSERFGIVVAHASKTVGFLKVESENSIVIKWKLDHKNPFNETSFEIEKLRSVVKQTNKLEFIYLGGNNWVLKAYDEKSWDNKTLLETLKGTNIKLH